MIRPLHHARVKNPPCGQRRHVITSSLPSESVDRDAVVPHRVPTPQRRPHGLAFSLTQFPREDRPSKRLLRMRSTDSETRAACRAIRIDRDQPTAATKSSQRSTAPWLCRRSIAHNWSCPGRCQQRSEILKTPPAIDDRFVAARFRPASFGFQVSRHER